MPSGIKKGKTNPSSFSLRDFRMFFLMLMQCHDLSHYETFLLAINHTEYVFQLSHLSRFLLVCLWLHLLHLLLPLKTFEDSLEQCDFYVFLLFLLEYFWKDLEFKHIIKCSVKTVHSHVNYLEIRVLSFFRTILSKSYFIMSSMYSLIC